LETEQVKAQENAEAYEKLDKIKEHMGALSRLIFAEPEQPNVDAALVPTAEGEPMEKSGNAVIASEDESEEEDEEGELEDENLERSEDDSGCSSTTVQDQVHEGSYERK
jgi:hypothetical protein